MCFFHVRACGVADHGDACRDIFGDDGAHADGCVVADGEILPNVAALSEEDAIADFYEAGESDAGGHRHGVSYDVVMVDDAGTEHENIVAEFGVGTDETIREDHAALAESRR